MWVVKFKGATMTFQDGSHGLCGCLTYWADANDAALRGYYVEAIVVWVDDYTRSASPCSGLYDLLGKRFKQATDEEIKRFGPKPRTLGGS